MSKSDLLKFKDDNAIGAAENSTYKLFSWLANEGGTAIEWFKTNCNDCFHYFPLVWQELFEAKIMAVTAATSQMRKRMGNKHGKSSSIVLIVFL